MGQSLSRTIERQQFLFLGVFATSFSLSLGFGPKPLQIYQTEAVVQVPVDRAVVQRAVVETDGFEAAVFHSGPASFSAEPLAQYLRSADLSREVMHRLGAEGRLVSQIVYSVDVDQPSGTLRLTASGPSAPVNESLLHTTIRAASLARRKALSAGDHSPDRMLGGSADIDEQSFLVSAPNSRPSQPWMSLEFVLLAAVVSGALATSAALIADRRR